MWRVPFERDYDYLLVTEKAATPAVCEQWYYLKSEVKNKMGFIDIIGKVINKVSYSLVDRAAEISPGELTEKLPTLNTEQLEMLIKNVKNSNLRDSAKKELLKRK